MQDVSAVIFARRAVARFGVAPLTSMFWYSESNRRHAADWRPEIHDSDGLAMWTGAGERIWRPMNNPPAVMVNSHADENPRGFGLMQRDRSFENYQDDGVFYDRRPSLWVEPLGAWGRGAVYLVEIPTDDEIYDNIVAFWVPETPVRAGDRLAYDYRLHWLAGHPYPPREIGRTVATRVGTGGVPGQPRSPDQTKVVIDFAGGPLAELPKSEEPRVEVVVTASRGRIVDAYPLQVVGTDCWRALFDVAVTGSAPVDLRLYLRHERLGPLTETWLWQIYPQTIRS